MPSIFNHDNNACWGIRRTSYNIFNDPIAFEVSVNKTEVINGSVVNQTVNKIDNFHGSSNGYYGFHLPTNLETTDCSMDTSNDSDLVVSNEIQYNNFTSGQSVSNNSPWKRKRSYPKEQEDSFKRVKIEESVDVPTEVTPTEVQQTSESTMESNNDLPVYSLYRCTMSHYM